jgi:hypothetical protein
MKQERQTKQQQTNTASSRPLSPRPRSLLVSRSLSFPAWISAAQLLVILFALTDTLSSCYSSDPSLTPPISPASTYTARIPGPDCDQNSNLSGVSWQIGTQFKRIPTPATATTHSSVTPTPELVRDPSTRTSCQSDGLQMKHLDHFGAYAEVIFRTGNNELASHFSTTITAKVISGTDTASLYLGVRRQDPPYATNNDSGYGDEGLAFTVNGFWDVTRTNNTSGQVAASLSRGFAEPATTVTLGATVDGPVMTFSINGKKVTTVTDTTYPKGYSLAFGIADAQAQSPPTALFSQFTYTPLPATQTTNASALATATAQTVRQYQTPYTATTPGFGCDKGPGQWEPLTAKRNGATSRCLPEGLEISQDGTTKTIGTLPFYWLEGSFPQNYRLQAQINLSSLNDGCAGLKTHADTQSGGYGFLVCSNGAWSIRRFDSQGGEGHILSEGFVSANSSYLVEADAQGSQQSLKLDGNQVASVTDNILTGTDHVSLLMYSGEGKPGSAIFSGFVFTPLP